MTSAHTNDHRDDECAPMPVGAADAHTRADEFGECADLPDERIARIAARRRGIVTTAELRAAGLTRHGIASREERGWLHKRHAGVFSVGHPGDIPLARETAALLACGEGAVLSHRSAAAIWDLMPVADSGPVDVSMRPGRQPRHAGIRIHRPKTLDAPDVRRREGLLVTSVERTIADLARTEPVERVVAEALARRLTTKRLLEKRAAGVPKLRAVLDDGPRFTRSEAERRLIALLERAGLPMPQTNARIAGLEVDAVWHAQRLVVEVDGYAFHGHRAAFERDRERDQRLTLAGYDVVRITWRQLTQEPERTVATLAALLAGR